MYVYIAAHLLYHSHANELCKHPKIRTLVVSPYHPSPLPRNCPPHPTS